MIDRYYLYFIHLTISLNVGFLPYIRIPTRNIFDVSNIISQIEMMSNRVAIIISTNGTGVMAERKMIIVGVKIGIIVRIVESVELGSFIIIIAMNTGKISDIEMIEMIC